MLYYISPMHKGNIAQVNEIDREVFSTQWPPTNYKHELQNKLSRYIVAGDEYKTIEEPEVETHSEKVISGLASRIKQLFNPDRLFGNKVPPSNRQYILGFAGIWAMADEAHITNIAVRKHYQRRGIGELLLIAIIGLAIELKANIMTLEVRASNIPAQNLYRKYGFTQVGVRHGYYTDNHEDGLLMSTESITSISFQEHCRQLRQAYSRKYGIANDQITKIKWGYVSTKQTAAK